MLVQQQQSMQALMLQAQALSAAMTHLTPPASLAASGLASLAASAGASPLRPAAGAAAAPAGGGEPPLRQPAARRQLQSDYPNEYSAGDAAAGPGAPLAVFRDDGTLKAWGVADYGGGAPPRLQPTPPSRRPTP